MDTFQPKENIDEVYVDAYKLPDFDRRPEYYMGENMSYVFHICPLLLVVDGSKFAISSGKPSKFTLKSFKEKPQDVLVEVNSAIFKIIDARRSKGITSQVFHVLKKGESMSFEIGYKDLNNVSFGNLKNVWVTNAAGFITITHNDSLKKDDSDGEWGIDNGKKQLVRMIRSCKVDVDDPRHWKEQLSAETETEDVKRAERMFAEALAKKLHFNESSSYESDKKGLKMFISPEDYKKQEDEKKAKSEARRLEREQFQEEDMKKMKGKKKCAIS